MIDALPIIDHVLWMMWAGLAFVGGMMGALVVERLAWTYHTARRHVFERKYVPVIRRALAGDQAARHTLITGPRRRRLMLAELLVMPLIDDRDPGRITATRTLVRAMLLAPLGDRYLRSWWWWRRALILRAFGLLQMTNRTAAVVGALDDGNADVRGAALDALTDLRDPASLPAIVVRLHDPSLHRGRRAAALTAFGSQAEPLVLALSEAAPEHQVQYARVLALCGTELSRPLLVRWAADGRPEVRAAALEALGHVGLDAEAASVAIEGLESGDVRVRAMAARALRDYSGAGDAASRLAPHLDDAWPVALEAARSLRSIPDAGFTALRACAGRPDLAGLLARQMLWEAGHAS
jgi:HEAT repeat protein